MTTGARRGRRRRLTSRRLCVILLNLEGESMWLSRRDARIPAFWMATYRSRGCTRHAGGLLRRDDVVRGQKTSWGVVTSVPSAVDWLSTPMPRCWGLELTRAIRSLRRASGQMERRPLPLRTLGVVEFLGVEPNRGGAARDSKMSSRACNILLAATSETEEQNQSASEVSQMH